MPQLRKDPVTREWVIIATERSKRPSDFKTSEVIERRAEYVPECPFCPGNEHQTPPEVASYRKAGTYPNTPDWWVRVVPNKFPALAIEGDLERSGIGMYDYMNGVGAHEVIIETPRHDHHPALMPEQQLEEVIWMYRDRSLDLAQDKRFQYIMVFRNHGRVAGASLEHPHSQLIALPMVPADVRRRIEGASLYYDLHERCVYIDMVRQEERFGERVVVANEEFLAFTPFASKYPFETWIVPRRHQPSFTQIDREQARAFAHILKEVLLRMDIALNHPPYNFTLHTAPINQERNYHYFQWHLSIMPRLTIAAGFELGTGIYINLTTPEDAARHLREVQLGVETAQPEMSVPVH